MCFHEALLPDFHRLFDAHKQDIRNFPGCQHLELHQDPEDKRIRYTYSHWISSEALNAYRESELFGVIWPATRILFAERPKAFSLEKLEEIESRAWQFCSKDIPI